MQTAICCKFAKRTTFYRKACESCELFASNYYYYYLPALHRNRMRWIARTGAVHCEEAVLGNWIWRKTFFCEGHGSSQETETAHSIGKSLQQCVISLPFVLKILRNKDRTSRMHGSELSASPKKMRFMPTFLNTVYGECKIFAVADYKKSFERTQIWGKLEVRLSWEAWNKLELSESVQ